ncbi:hypothetical protein D3C81_08440 [compost metagenome]
MIKEVKIFLTCFFILLLVGIGYIYSMEQMNAIVNDSTKAINTLETLNSSYNTYLPVMEVPKYKDTNLSKTINKLILDYYEFNATSSFAKKKDREQYKEYTLEANKLTSQLILYYKDKGEYKEGEVDAITSN